MNEILPWIIIGIITIVALKKLDKILEKKPERKNHEYDYKPKPLMTKTELIFYDKIKTLESKNLHVLPQINLATIISKEGDYTYQTELYRNIDFAIFDELYKPILLVELNDKSHERKDRKERDKKVKEICSKAGIEIVTVDTKNPDINIVKSRLETYTCTESSQSEKPYHQF
jgi:hypothetical protein